MFNHMLAGWPWNRSRLTLSIAEPRDGEWRLDHPRDACQHVVTALARVASREFSHLAMFSAPHEPEIVRLLYRSSPHWVEEMFIGGRIGRRIIASLWRRAEKDSSSDDGRSGRLPCLFQSRSLDLHVLKRDDRQIQFANHQDFIEHVPMPPEPLHAVQSS